LKEAPARARFEEILQSLRFKALFALFGFAAAAWGQMPRFSGPAVSGRSLGAQSGRRSQQVSLRPFVSLRANYSDGLAAAGLDSEGNLLRGAAYGYEIAAGAYGAKAWRNTEMSGSFVGGYRQRSLARSLTGFNAMGNLGISHNFTRRLRLATTTGYGSTVQSGMIGLGLITPFQQLDPAFDELPEDEVFDNRITFLNNSNSLIFQQTSRLSHAATGGIFIINRRNGLPDARGVTAQGDSSYRIGRRTSVGAYYAFNSISFSETFGNSKIQKVGFTFSQQFGRMWELVVRGGVNDLENEGLSRVELDPIVQEILGIRQGVETFYRRNYLPAWRVALLGRLRNSSFGVTSAQDVRGGNGVFLTSNSRSYRGYYSFTTNRRLNWQLTASRTDMSGRLRFQGVSKNSRVGVSLGYQVFPGFHTHASFGWRWQEITVENTLKNNGLRAQIGITYSPGDIPFALW
jgi:hypothetical protein